MRVPFHQQCHFQGSILKVYLQKCKMNYVHKGYLLGCILFKKRGNNMHAYMLLLEKRISEKINQKLIKMLPRGGGKVGITATENEIRIA